MTDAPVRHWALDAALGAGVALFAISLAHAALPERQQITTPLTSQPVRAAIAAAEPARPAWLIAFGDPVPGREIISPFGLRQLPWEENGRLHEGVDIAAPLGSPVLLAADGVVVRAGTGEGYGRFVEVRHAEGLTSLYAHMGAIAPGLAPGVRLTAGAVVGQIGSSGTSTGPHLHFELRDAKDRPLNPGLFLGRAFASQAELPLKKALRFPRAVRVAYVSFIPKSKRALMEARLADEADGSSVTVEYGDGRPHARYRVVQAKGTEAPAPEETEGS
jgi:murein DD-endopeptidase MepM/ murein hydrolase activator NlpD